MRRALLVATLALSQLAFAQASKWPQPIIRGTLILWKGEKGKEVAKEAFLQLARNKSSIVVFADSVDERKGEWHEVPNAQVIGHRESIAMADDAARWIETVRDPEGVRSALTMNTTSVVAMPVSSFGFHAIQPFYSALRVEGESVGGPILVSLEDGVALVMQGRYLSVRGEGKATFTINQVGKVEKVVIEGRERADLIALQRRAIEMSMPTFPPKAAAVPEVKQGSLFIVGGGGMPQGLLQKFIEACGGPDAPIVYVPCEEAEVIPVEPDFVRALKAAGAKNVSWIHTKDRDKSDKDEEFLKPLKDAKGVWFGGGRQWNLVDSYMDTQAHELMRKVLERGGAIGGSSAGASIQAEFLARGDPLGNANIIAPGYTRGLGFLPGAAVDQHFTQRVRHKDMSLLMKTFPQLLGIGIDEATAIIVKGTTAEVTGRGQVFFYDYRTAPTVDTDYIALKQGDKYDLKDRKKIE